MRKLFTCGALIVALAGCGAGAVAASDTLVESCDMQQRELARQYTEEGHLTREQAAGLIQASIKLCLEGNDAIARSLGGDEGEEE